MFTACLQAYHSGVRLRGHGQTSRTAARQNVQGRRSPRQMLNPNTRQANGTIAVLFQKLLDPPLHARPSFTDEQIHKAGKENIPTKLITHSEEETQLLATGRSERRRKQGWEVGWGGVEGWWKGSSGEDSVPLRV